MLLLGLFFVLASMNGHGVDTVATRQIVTAPPSVSQASDWATQSERRVLNLSYRLATSGVRECAEQVPLDGFLVRHIGQYDPADRARASAQFGLDKGPLVAATVPGSPAAMAGVTPGDLLVAINGTPITPIAGNGRSFNQHEAQAYSDALHDALAQVSVGGLVRLSLLRNRRPVAVDYAPIFGCPSIVHLARSARRNAFADGRHVFLSTAIVDATRDDDELAFILAHEMAHNILHHAAILRLVGVEHGLLRGVGKKGKVVRETEREADLLGADLMLDARFDPLRGLKVLSEVDRDPFRIGLLDEHDSAPRRAAAIRSHVARRLAAPRSAVTQPGSLH